MKSFLIIDQLNDKQILQLYDLYQKMWWSEGRTLEEIAITLKNSLSFGLIETGTQDLVGYARVLTDEIKYAFVFDVMVVEDYRGKGLGKMIMDAVVGCHRLKGIKNFELTCVPELTGFYGAYGFSENYGEVRPMRCSRTIV
jgi:predicted GNAT family N-acyltransferase